LFAAEPEAERQPNNDERRGNERNPCETEAEPGEQRIRPGADLIARAINECANEIFWLCIYPRAAAS
jgi:hypothetical protein